MWVGVTLRVAAAITLHLTCHTGPHAAGPRPPPPLALSQDFSKISGNISVGGSSRKISRICSAREKKLRDFGDMGEFSGVFSGIIWEFLSIFGECGILALGN